jgi:ABC-type multidrug transport system permease subunit
MLPSLWKLTKLFRKTLSSGVRMTGGVEMANRQSSSYIQKLRKAFKEELWGSRQVPALIVLFTLMIVLIVSIITFFSIITGFTADLSWSQLSIRILMLTMVIFCIPTLLIGYLIRKTEPYDARKSIMIGTIGLILFFISLFIV